MKGEKKKSDSIIGAALRYSDGLSKWTIVFLCIVSLLCATCNVLVPILQKQILQYLDVTDDRSLWLLLGVSIAGCVFLMLENFLNVSILMRFRRELESAMEFSLAYKEQPLLNEKGVGVYSSAIMGDSEQIGRVLAAGWFSIIFNFIGAIVSIIISATWEQYFLFISLISYLLILVIIFVSAAISAKYFRREREISYVLGAKVREMVDTYSSVMTYGGYLEFQKRFENELRERERCVKHYERAAALSTSLIRMVQMIAVSVFFFFAAYELRGIPDVSQRMEEFPVIVALVSYFETIFVPVGALNTTAINAAKFRVFYSTFNDTVTQDGFGEMPENLSLKIHGLNVIDGGLVYFSNFSLDVNKTYGFVGMEREYKARLISYLRGESYPPDGHIELGGARIYEIEKNLRLTLLTFNSRLNDIYGEGLEYNLTLGRPLLSDAEYDEKKEEYFASIRAFFDTLDEGTALKRKNLALTHMMFRDFFALDVRFHRAVITQKSLLSEFAKISDREAFIHSIGTSSFVKKYARKSRYERIIRTLELEDLELRSFGAGGKNLLVQERALILLARFLLSETQNPFVLVDPLGNLPLHSQKAAVKFLKEATRGRPGIIFESDLEALHALSDEILYFEEGYIQAVGPHSTLMRKCKPYHDLYTKNVASGKKS